MEGYNLCQDVDVGKFQKDMDLDDFVNTYAAKGPIIIHGKDMMYIWTDRKTSDYPNRGIAGKLVFRGGNWRHQEDKAPADVYVRQLAEETMNKSGRAPDGADRAIREMVLAAATPMTDYFTALPGRLLQNPKLPQAWYCDIASVFVSEIYEHALLDVLQVPHRESADDRFHDLREALNLISPESGQHLTTLDALRYGTHVPFGFGDDIKMLHALGEYLGIKGISMHIVPEVEVVRLSTTPDIPFAERAEQLRYLRRDNNPLGGDVAMSHVFETRRK